MKWKTGYNQADFPNDNEVNNLPSMTIPDQSLTVKEIMHRFARGLSTTQREGEYYGEEDIPDLRGMDLSEIEDLKLANLADIARLQEELQTKEKKANYLRNQKLLEKKFEDYKKEKIQDIKQQHLNKTPETEILGNDN